MRYVVRSLVIHRAAALAAALVLGCVPATLMAQTAAAPPTPAAKETPRPQDIDPAVDTSRTPDSGAAPRSQDSPRPQDVNPGVDTSATSPSSTAPANAAPATGTAASKPAGSAPTTNGAGAKTPAGTPQPGGASRTQGKGKALDRLELDTTQITGNRELPKVLYIVPWKRSDLGDLVGKPVNSLLDEVLAPVDRDVFKRENRYYRAVMPEGGAATGTPASASPSGSASAAPPAKDER
ncbi:MAG TPA: hypothetical protein VGE96_00425 [Steroidobacteraceae bacterium]|jgi:hypothetical protein